MVVLFRKQMVTLLSVILLNAVNYSIFAWDQCCDNSCNRLYIGAFGGELYSNSIHLSQMGTAFFTEVEGGPLAVEARGNAETSHSGFGGIQIGYEWSKCLDNTCSDWSLAPAAELEAYWYNTNRRGHLFNDTDPTRLPEHDFLNTYHVKAGVYLANLVFSLNNTWGLSPYVGVGAGATRISLDNAESIQVAPPEEGINHFNSRPNDSTWAFAAQIKAGLRYNICNLFHIFGEYRYLFVDSSNYIFGSTVYPTHAVTSPWLFKEHDRQFNGFAFGVQFDLGGFGF